MPLGRRALALRTDLFLVHSETLQKGSRISEKPPQCPCSQLRGRDSPPPQFQRAGSWVGGASVSTSLARPEQLAPKITQWRLFWHPLRLYQPPLSQPWSLVRPSLWNCMLPLVCIMWLIPKSTPTSVFSLFPALDVTGPHQPGRLG